MRALIPTTAAVIVAAAPAGAAWADTSRVRVSDNYFVRPSPQAPTVSVHRGDIVRWEFEGQNAHNVTVSSGPERFRARTRISGVFSKRLKLPGTYRIYCTIHGARDMAMTLKVEK